LPSPRRLAAGPLITTGETIDDLAEFDPEAFVDGLLNRACGVPVTRRATGDCVMTEELRSRLTNLNERIEEIQVRL